MSSVRNIFVLALVLTVSAIALGAAAAPASAADSVVVNMIAVDSSGGTTTVPSGAAIIIQTPGYAQGTYGLINNFLIKEHTTLSITGSTSKVYDLSGGWSAPQHIDGFWLTRLPNTETGISLAAGESIVVTFDVTFTRPLLVAFPPVGSSGDNGPFLIHEDGPLSITITAA